MACSSKRYEDAKNENQRFSIDDIGHITLMSSRNPAKPSQNF